ncbi:MAG: hypothetical protein HPY50_10180 [Firmicutes bacterium]|nr:hypothetical protein [Bacillota bacterium]
MNGCPISYTDPCGQCAQYGKCAPSQAVQKVEALEGHIQDLKKLVEQMLEKK